MRKFYNFCLTLTAFMMLPACSDYLDIVPDNIATIDNAFTLRTNAEKFLFTCYSYFPPVSDLNRNPALEGGDELLVGFQSRAEVTKAVGGWRIRNGEQNTSSPYCDYWTGTSQATGLFEGIRTCNLFIENIDRVPDMQEYEILQWKDEVKFLKAYYHFYLLRMYGPIPIKDENLGLNATIDEVHVYRNTLDEVFEYITNLLDEIIEAGNLPGKIESEASDLGRISMGIVKAFKAQVLMYAASPLFNGNSDYRGYVDNRGVAIFCPEKTEEQKAARWRAAADACKDAIDYLENPENGGYGLYKYESNEYVIGDTTRCLLTIRGALTDPWNKEIVWGYTKSWVSLIQQWSVPVNCLAACSAYQGVLSVPLKIANLFYTMNGVPIEEDKTWDYENRFSLKMGDKSDALFMQPFYRTVSMQYGREFRYYADLAFDGAAWFGNGFTSEGGVTYVNAKSGQTSCNVSTAKSNLTGIWPRKYVNYKTTALSSSFSFIKYPFPIITMSGLYLYYAEALNECGEDASAVLHWVDLIRRRAGLPDVVTSWTNYSRIPNKYTSKEGRREIIHRERSIEMIFEGERYWDLRRWKEAFSELNKPLTGWNRYEDTVEGYYKECVIQYQSFETKDYFSPIKNSEVFSNSNTMQNPGW